MGLFRKLDHYSSFRRIALAQWEPPEHGLIYGGMDIDVTDAGPFLKELKEKHGQSVSYGVLVGKALAVALNAMPEINARVIGRKIWVKDDVDIYFQVDVGKGADLAGAVVRNADRKSMPAISAELAGRARKIRAGKDEQYEKAQKKGLIGSSPIWMLRLILRLFSFLMFKIGMPAAWLGASDPDPFGSIMVTNVGQFGIDVAYAPLVPWTKVPFVVLVGAAKQSPCVRDGEVVIREFLPVSITIDHRVMDGAHVGKFVAISKGFVEKPNEEGTVTVKGTTYGAAIPESEWGAPAGSVEKAEAVEPPTDPVDVAAAAASDVGVRDGEKGSTENGDAAEAPSPEAPAPDAPAKD